MSFVKLFARALAAHAEANGQRMDASQVLHLERELTVQRDVIIANFGPLKAERFAPLNTETPAWAEFISHPILTDTGRAKVVANNATDLPTLGIELDDNKVPVLTVAGQWRISWLEALAPEGINKISQKRRAAADAIARVLDQVCMIGYPTANLGGFLNNPSVPEFALPNGDWVASATDAEILEDLRAWEESVIATSGEGGTTGMMYPNALVLPGAEVSRLMANAGTGTDTSIWGLFTREQSQGVMEGRVDQWELDRSSYAADVGGIRRGVMYHKDPAVLECENPLPFQEQPGQERGLTTVIPVVGRTAGVTWRNPAMGSYADLG
jgi:hypothetical protein